MFISPSGESAAAGSSTAEPGSSTATGGDDGAPQQPGKQGEGETHPHHLSYRQIVDSFSLHPDVVVFKEGSRVSSSLAALQAEREVLLRSAQERDAEITSLKQQVQQQQGYQDLERDRLNRELEALRAQLQQQVSSPVLCSVFQGWKRAPLLFERCQTLFCYLSPAEH